MVHSGAAAAWRKERRGERRHRDVSGKVGASVWRWDKLDASGCVCTRRRQLAEQRPELVMRHGRRIYRETQSRKEEEHIWLEEDQEEQAEQEDQAMQDARQEPDSLSAGHA